jgi:DNA-binding NtrC family response regulator
MESGPAVVAVINSSRDVVDMLRIAFEDAGLVAVTALTDQIRDGEVDLERLVQHHDPKLVLYDIAPPYDANWRLFQHLMSRPVMAGRPFMLTTTNLSHVREFAASHHQVFEVIGKPYDLEQIVQAAKAAIAARTPQ